MATTMMGMFNPGSMMLLLVGTLLGGILGWVGARWWSRMTTPRYIQYMELLMKAPMIGIIYDVKEDRLEPVPLQPLKHGVYVSLDRQNPMIAFTHPATTPKWSWRLGKPILLGISAGMYALALDPKILAPFGIAGLSLELDALKHDISSQSGLAMLKEQLVKKLAQMGNIEIPIGPDIKLAITYHVPALLRALLSTIAHFGNAIFTSTQETSQVALELAQYAQRASAIELAKRSSLFRMIITMLVLGAGLAIMFMLLVPMIGHLAGGMVHVARPV